ncbi:MAG TPA: response regulator [Patescibacteria group bacterium]|nr:response regulator [Patescibacteria group bacterium]
MSNNNVKILVADDSAFMRRILIDILKERGKYDHFVEAGNGDDVLRLYRTDRPNIILLDLIMPGKDGFEVLRELGGKADVKIIVISAVGQNQLIEEAAKLGAKGFIIKPFDGKDVVEKMAALGA